MTEYTTFSVLNEISQSDQDFSVTASKFSVGKNENVTLIIDMKKGTNVTMVIEFGDNYTDTRYNVEGFNNMEVQKT